MDGFVPDAAPLPAGGIARMVNQEKWPAPRRWRKGMEGAGMNPITRIRAFEAEVKDIVKHPNQHGIGNSADTFSGWSFSTTTRSEKAPQGNTVLQEGETRPELREDRVKRGATLNPQSVGSNAPVHAPRLTSDRESNFTYGLNSENLYQGTLANKNYFPIQIEADKEVLQKEIDKIWLRAPNDDSALKTSAEKVILAQTLSSACGGSPIAAARGLAYLQNLNLAACIADPEQGSLAAVNDRLGDANAVRPYDDGAFNQLDLINAWRIAQELESTPTAFQLLKRITAHPVLRDPMDPSKTLALHATHTRFEDVMLHVYLQGAREKVKEAWKHGLRRVEPHPASIYAYLEEKQRNMRQERPVPTDTEGPAERDAAPSPQPASTESGTAQMPVSGNGNGSAAPAPAPAPKFEPKLTLLDKGLLAAQNYLQQSANRVTNLQAERSPNELLRRLG